MDVTKRKSETLFYRRLLSHHFAFVVQFAFAYVGTVAHMALAGGAVRSNSGRLGLVVRTALGAALLRVSAFGIWHILKIKCVRQFDLNISFLPGP